ncbi:tRNA (adenine(58)-N(1))-methyltransferase mitochondrial [Dissostichus eleginoides]|uniref:tRNA (adenine(58)-N(1))-methyltransferase n=1 Tax=Dissostichus eleginoides TaxID=100907 RepID=A0AAD9C0J5_DISEL|nr:tRNA (adenine(58)-N(1))-methyltransferase mitochondrial [Dissostichus eleginoides]
MAMQMPFAGLLLMHRLVRSSSQRQLGSRFILHKCNRRQTRTFSTAFVNCNENKGDDSDPSPLSSNLTFRQALLSKRRPLSPLERISSLMPQEALSPEVMQLRDEQNQEDPEEEANIHTQEEHEAIPKEEDSETHHASDAAMETDEDKAGQPAGRFLKTGRGIPILIRRPSLEDYVLYMKRGPAIAYPKDAATMMMMMDVSEGDCVLESGSGSGAMSLFLSRAVGCKGSVLSVEVREDHHKRAVLNYNRWRTAWSLRQREEWPDNVQFHRADLCTASSLIAGQGFNAVALDMVNPHLVLPTVIPHLHTGAVCAVYLANITQVIDLLEGLRCLALPLLCERIIEVPVREWLVAPAQQKDGKYCVRKAPVPEGEQREETETEETITEEPAAFGSFPYIARPHPEQISHTAFLVKLRKCER